MTNNVAKTTFGDSNELFVWLLNSDIHFILCHPHQGLVHKWKPNDIYKNITLLKNHFGFPFRSQLLCPVFTQNKYDYIYAVKDICIPTLKITIHMQDTWEASFDQFSQTINNEWNHWVVKLPYTTNKHAIWYCADYQSLRHRLKQLFKELKFNETSDFAGIDYILLQPRLPNKKEMKVVLMNGRDPYLMRSESRQYGTKFANQEDIFNFACYAWNRLAKASPQAILDGLFRVDVMTFNDKLVVNEFESLEADYHAKEDERTFMMDSSLKLYWKNKLFQMIQMHHQSL